MHSGKKIWMILLLLTGGSIPLSSCIYACSQITELRASGLEAPNENLRIFTDRAIYAVGEKILFRCFNLSQQAMKEQGWSRVLYLELTDTYNASLAGGKYIFGSQGAEGALAIPASIPAGCYYLKAYTKWMRNFSPYEYAWATVTIINPFKDELQGNNHMNTAAGRSPDQKWKVSEVLPEAVECSAGQKTYEKRAKVTLHISVPHDMPSSPDGYCITVSRSPAVSKESFYFDIPDETDQWNKNGIRYYPELRGVTVSGNVMKKEGNIPYPFAHVHLSVIGDQPDYTGVIANDRGQFNIVLPPRSGQQELFIGAETADDGPLDILIDNDFSAETVDLPRTPFILFEENRQIAREIMFNMQIDRVYRQNNDTVTDTGEHTDPYPCFYGEPPIVIHIDDYIKLPTLEEFIFELIPQVNITRRKGQTFVTLTGLHSDLALYKPLVLLDLVPVFDLDALLQTTYEDIERIEVVNATFVRGDMCFGGIISVFSRKDDLAGVDLKKNSYFLDYKAYEPVNNPEWPDYSGGSAANIPDFRNTLYWQADKKIRPGETISLEFYTSDNQGEYTVLVRGVSTDGVILSGTCSFNVK